tara:strand:- start:1464 stop:2957 length:1494 start_codon:yes stop_codon:yes gene_type:complete
MASLFGFEFKRKSQDKEEDKKLSFVAPMEDDGSSYVQTGGHYGQYVDIGGTDGDKNEADNVRRYRDIAQHPECDAAIEDIINEAIVSDSNSAPVEIIMDDLEQPDNIKKVIKEEFENVVKLLQFNHYGHEIFRKWYTDGRLFYHIIIDDKQPKKGILELRPIDPTRIRKVKEIDKVKDSATGADIIKSIDEYYIYQDTTLNKSNQGLKISADAIQYTTSGLLEGNKKTVLSYLHKAIKPVNQLRMMEDSLVIYRLSRAPERRIFYIDVGNLPKGKAEEYLRGIMNQYRNKLVYDANTGEIKDDKKHMSMLEDFWLPRREGGRGTEITTLPGGENLGQIDDILYFQKKLYKSLNVPVNRLESENGFSLGRSTEISRDEVKFQKFINRLRKKFSWLFLDLLKTQLLLKGVITESDWSVFRENIVIDYIQDSYFSELKENEIIRERVGLLTELDQYVGSYYSKEWIRKNVLMLSDDEIKQMNDEIEEERESGDIPDEDDL